MKKFAVIAYHTPDEIYSAEAEKLIESLKALNLDYRLRRIKDQGSWGANTNFKPVFIHECLRFFNMPVLYVDVDAVFRKYPDFIDSLNCDFACHIRDGFELLSGTLYFQPTERAFELINSWMRRVDNEPRIWEQIHLHNALRFYDLNHPGQEINFVELPATYCQIFDIMRTAGDPVIEHFQASRRAKDVFI